MSTSRSSEVRAERIAASPLWTGSAFRNPSGKGPQLQGSPLGMMREWAFGRREPTPLRPLESVSPLETWAREPASGLRVTWLGHSTVVLELDGVRVITDPVWARRASPLSFAGPRRFQPVPVELEALPPLDAVLLSHDHYDHLDRPTVVALAAGGTPFVTPLGVGAHLEAWGVDPSLITELDWWDATRVVSRDGRRAVRVTAGPAQHFSGRGLHDRNRTLWASYVIESDRHRVLFGGDTGPTEEHRELGRRFGAFDLTMLEIGAWNPAWADIHLGPAAALEAHTMLGGGPLLPIHWGTFDLAMHDWFEPIEHVFAEAPRRGIPLLTPSIGAPVEPGHEAKAEPWWRPFAQRAAG